MADRVKLKCNKEIVSTYGEFETVSFEAPYEENKEFIKWLNENLKPLSFEHYLRFNLKKPPHSQYDQEDIKIELEKTLIKQYPDNTFIVLVTLNKIIIGIFKKQIDDSVLDYLGLKDYPVTYDSGVYHQEMIVWMFIDISRIYEK